jgi:tocopherol O-methyltransferase
MSESHDLRDAIREHYDRLSFFYRLFWGDHIHHGYWQQGEESAVCAQEQLIARLAQRAGIPRGARVLDVGCGLGGSSLWLARRLGCSVLGITLSPIQATAARERARQENLEGTVAFAVLDANRLALAPASFDIVWCIECSEHLEDKPDFFRACGRLLRPGGRLALCAWLANDGSAADPSLLAAVCHGMLCPSLGSLGEYVRWLRDGGFEAIEAEDVTPRVEKTWDVCEAILDSQEVKPLLAAVDEPTRAFLNTFGIMRRAYASGAMGYGMFTAHKA